MTPSELNPFESPQAEETSQGPGSIAVDLAGAEFGGIIVKKYRDIAILFSVTSLIGLFSFAAWLVHLHSTGQTIVLFDYFQVMMLIVGFMVAGLGSFAIFWLAQKSLPIVVNAQGVAGWVKDNHGQRSHKKIGWGQINEYSIEEKKLVCLVTDDGERYIVPWSFLSREEVYELKKLFHQFTNMDSALNLTLQG